MQAVSASCTSRTKDFPARRRGRRPRRPLHVKAYPIGKDRRFRRLYEFADPFFLFIPNAAGRGQAAAPTAKTGCGANIHGDARIRPGAAGILRRFQLLRMTPLPVPDCGQPGTTSPDGGGKGVPLPPGGPTPSAARYAFLGTARWTGGAKYMNVRAADQWSALRERGPRHVRLRFDPLD